MSEDEQKKKFALMIADAIQQLLRDSDELANILEEAHEEGYDILLSIFSGIMIRRREAHAAGKGSQEEALPIRFEFTEFDKEFLKSIGIRVPD
jgi:hypothetical protein